MGRNLNVLVGLVSPALVFFLLVGCANERELEGSRPQKLPGTRAGALGGSIGTDGGGSEKTREGAFWRNVEWLSQCTVQQRSRLSDRLQAPATQVSEAIQALVELRPRIEVIDEFGAMLSYAYQSDTPDLFLGATLYDMASAGRFDWNKTLLNLAVEWMYGNEPLRGEALSRLAVACSNGDL